MGYGYIRWSGNISWTQWILLLLMPTGLIRLWRPQCPAIKVFTLVGHVHSSLANSYTQAHQEGIHRNTAGDPQIIVTHWGTSEVKHLSNVGHGLPLELPCALRSPGGESYFDSALISTEDKLIRNFHELSSLLHTSGVLNERREMWNGTSLLHLPPRGRVHMICDVFILKMKQ